jgi:hypothetical protein
MGSGNRTNIFRFTLFPYLEQQNLYDFFANSDNPDGETGITRIPLARMFFGDGIYAQYLVG